MKKQTKITFVVFFALFIIGCFVTENSKSGLAKVQTEVGYPEDINENEILIYNRFEQKLILYDEERKQEVRHAERPNWFQYEFDPLSDRYTSGNSFTNGFSVIEVNEKKQVKEILKLEDDEAIFPLACNEKYEIYTHSYYDEMGIEIDSKRRLCILENGHITNIEGAKGLISKGVLKGSELYYSVYDKEKDRYTINRIDMNEPDAVTCVKSDLICDAMIITKYGILYSDNDYFYMGDQRIKKMSLNYGFFESKYIYQIGINENNELVLHVFDLEEMEDIWVVDDIIDFEIAENEVIVYGNGFIERKSLN